MEHKCKYCNKLFTFEFRLKVHIRVHAKEKPFKSDCCKKYFKRKSNLAQHFITHTFDFSHIRKHCGKCFALKQYLKVHG